MTFHVTIKRGAVETCRCESRGDSCLVFQPASATASSDAEEQEENNRGGSKTNNQENTRDSTLIVEEPVHKLLAKLTMATQMTYCEALLWLLSP